MKTAWVIGATGFVVLVLVALAILGREDAAPPSTQPTPSVPAVRIGLIPERDIFTLRKRNQVLGKYLSEKLNRPVELVTCNTYETVLLDFAEKRVDAAFLGSLVTVLAVDRMDAKVLAKTQTTGGASTYKGEICVNETSPYRSISDLRGCSVAMVPTTTAGHLFPMYVLYKAGLLEGEGRVRLVWVGTHDHAVQAMADGEVDVACVKDLRLAVWQERNPQRKIRILAESYPCPENALVVRADVADTLGRNLADALIAMDRSDDGRRVLQEYGASRFLPCDIKEYSDICATIREIGPRWSALGIAGPAPEKLCKELGR